jgi:hypothetical protein
MRGLRRFLLPLALFAFAGVVGLAAIADHRWKQRRTNHAEILEWQCVHEHTHCGGPSSAAMERHWNERQLGYEVAVSLLGASAILLAADRAFRPRNRGTRPRAGGL